MRSAPTIPSYFMYLSLALLFVFLSWWVYGTYEDRRAEFQRDIDITLSDAIRNVQDSMVQRLLADKINLNTIRPNKIAIQYIKEEGHQHSIEIEEDIEDVRFIQKTDSMQISIRRSNISDTLMDRMHVLVDLLGLESAGQDSSVALINSYLSQIELNFDAKAIDKKLPKSYRILKFKSDSTFGDIRTHLFTDLNSNRSYYVAFENYSAHLLKDIVPHILFALLLFGAVAASFFYLDRTIKLSQHTVDLKNEFISNITHELKTPISTVKVALEAVQDFNIKDDALKTAEYLDISRNELNRLSLLIDNVLKMSMMDQGWEGMKFLPINLNELIQEIVETQRVRVKESYGKIDFESQGSPTIIQGDRIHLAHVVYNVLDNAIKYGDAPDVNIRIEEIDDFVQVRISDNGPGISDTEKKRIFDRFYRIPQGDLHNVKGHGIGLSYAAEVMQKHDGDITVKDNPEGGSTFILKFKKR